LKKSPTDREKRARFRDLAKQGKVQTAAQFEQRRAQLELDFERNDRQPGKSR
jgi:hypothetical protein